MVVNVYSVVVNLLTLIYFHTVGPSLSGLYKEASVLFLVKKYSGIYGHIGKHIKCPAPLL